MRVRQKSVGTIGLIFINVLVFVVLMFWGNAEDPVFMMEHGAMYIPGVLERKEYYRFVTSMFLHFGIEHLMNNMVMLGALGWNLEQHTGTIHFLLTYFFSGIGSGILSMAANLHAGTLETVSAGASGAVFGLMGALLCAVIRSQGRLGTLNERGLLFMIGLSLYFGITSSGVDNMAHIGGLVCGFLIEAILAVLWKRRNRGLE